uniref:SGNH hydrolase-type esterase domain-containing protein n=1 Tax=Salmo trutta TaxID=8032 RepID=A0A674A4Y1_SALTR
MASGGKRCRNAQPMSLIQPTETFNRFSPLSESESEAETSLVSTPPAVGSEMPKAPTISSDKLKTLVIGDSITRSIRLKTNHPAIIHCLPGGRATDVKANLKTVLAKAKTGECREYRDIVIHVGTNDVRMKQSEVTKRNIASACKSARKMCRHRLIVSGPLPVRGSDELYSRVSQLNRWLKTVFCPSQKIEFVDNWPSFWDSPTNRTKPGLLRSDGLHPSWRGALILSTNIDRALTPLAPQLNRVQARQQAVSQPASLVESATSTVSVVSSAFPIETVSVPRSRLGKIKNGGVYFSNLTSIKISSIPAIIERDCDTSHLKIGLLNVRSLTSK